MTGVPEVLLEQFINGEWVDFTSRLASLDGWGVPMQITRGVAEDGGATPGSFTLALENDDGALTPGYGASPYYPHLTRFRPIRLRIGLNGGWHGRFTGYVDTESLTWANSPATECIVTMTCTDALGMVSEKPLRSAAVEAAVARGPLAYWPLTDGEVCAEQSGNHPLATLSPVQIGTDGEIAFGGGAVLPADTAGGVVFTHATTGHISLRTSVGIDLPASWSLSVVTTPAAKDGYLVQVGTDSYSLGIWYDSSTKKFSAIETMLDSSGDAIDYVLSTSTSAWSSGMETMTVTPTGVKLGSSGTTGSRHNSDTMLDSLISVGDGIWVESGRASVSDGEVKHLAFWSGTVPAGLASDTLTGPSGMFTMSTAVGLVMAWAGMPVTVVPLGTDQPVVLAKTEGFTALELLSMYARGSLARIFCNGDGAVVVAAWDYQPSPIIAPAAEIDPEAEWGAIPTSDVESALMTWPDGTTYTAASTTGSGQADLPGALPVSAGRSIADWTAKAVDAHPRFPAAVFDLLTLANPLDGITDGASAADGTLDGASGGDGVQDGGAEHGSAAAWLALADIGDTLEVPGLPTQLPSRTESGVLDSTVETLGVTAWTIQVTTSPDPRDRLLVVGDPVRGVVGGGRLASPLGPALATGAAWAAGDEVTASGLNAHAFPGNQMQSGTVTITPVANTPTSLAVTFPTAFTTTPAVVASLMSDVAGSTVQGVSVSSVSTTGFTVWVYRTDTTATVVHWLAAN